MRSAAAAVVIGLCLLGFALSANAQPAESVTMHGAVAELGTPAYDHNCQDDTLTLAWKLRSDQAQWQAASQIPAARFASLATRGASVRKATVVMKFNREGKLLWSRRLP